MSIEEGPGPRRTPAPPEQGVQAALDRYLADNGFTTASYNDDWVAIKLGPVPVRFRNTAGRKAAIPLHDLHHVATGYGTDVVGEAEIGAFELRAGCTTAAAYVLNGGAVLMGLVLAPRRVLRAWRDAAKTRSLYRLGIPYEELMALSVAALRQRIGIPEQAVARLPARLHHDAEKRYAGR